MLMILIILTIPMIPFLIIKYLTDDENWLLFLSEEWT